MNGHTLQGTDRAITPGIAVAALVAVSVTLAAVLGTWMLTTTPEGVGTVDAQTEIVYEGGELTVQWTQEGTASRLRVAVGTEVQTITEVGDETTLSASPDQQVVIIAERADGDRGDVEPRARRGFSVHRTR
jgi:FlaG/FlaF family flagellin (archaellin)